METKLNYKRTFFIGLAFLSISAFWQMYDNIIPLILQNTFELKETVTGVLMAMDNVLALFLLPVFGSLSDRVNTPLGKRTPFILGGTVLAVVFMMMLPIADRGENLVLFLIALFATLVSLGLYRSPAVALMPDLTPNRLRSRANAVINLMGAVGGVYALIMIRFLVGEGKRPSYLPLFASIAALMAVAVGVLLITIRENKLRKELEEAERAASAAGVSEHADDAGNTEKSAAAGSTEGAVAAYEGAKTEECSKREADSKLEKVSKPEKESKLEETSEPRTTKLPREVKRSMLFMLASIFLWYTAYNAVTTAFSRYTGVVWGMEGGSFANCLMVAMVAAIISYIPIGNISARFGRKKTIIGGVLLMTVCYLAAVFVNTYHPLINVAFALIGVGWAAINVNSYPMIVAMSQGGDIGKFTGTYYTFSMAAQIITPVLSGFLLENVSYRTLFPYAAFFSLLAFLTMTQVRHGDVKPQKKESLLENFDVDD
ncbi:MAG: MFS transporter [Acetatifactor sp.]|nr:MFS transporter [Acetatifactor sp.]